MKFKDMEDLAGLSMWSDTGTHFRAWQMVGTAGVTVADDIQADVRLNFGLEGHMKGICDGKNARMNGVKRQAAKLRMIGNIEELHAEHAMNTMKAPKAMTTA